MVNGTKNNDAGDDNSVRDSAVRDNPVGDNPVKDNLVKDDLARDLPVSENSVRDAVSALSENVRQRTRDELLELIRQVEDAVHRGTAQMQDYETFVLCKRELTRREVSYVL